mgnify:CR=1 FL=1
MQMVPDHLIRAKTTSLSALNLCINLAVDADSEEKKELNDKKICAALGNMDKAQNISPEKKNRFEVHTMITCRNQRP